MFGAGLAARGLWVAVLGFAVPSPAGRSVGRGDSAGGRLATGAARSRFKALLQLPGGSKPTGSDGKGSVSLR